MATATIALDEAIKEYLLFRGFTDTLKSFEEDKRNVKDKGYEVMPLTPIVFHCLARAESLLSRPHCHTMPTLLYFCSGKPSSGTTVHLHTPVRSYGPARILEFAVRKAV